MLSKQLHEMSKIAWQKHVLVKWSMNLEPAGVVVLAICAAVRVSPLARLLIEPEQVTAEPTASKVEHPPQTM